MTDAITELQLENAASDALSLEAFVNNSATPGVYTTRLGRSGRTLAKIDADTTASVAAIIAASTGNIVGTNLVFSKNYATLNLADAVAVANGFALVIDSNFTLAGNTTLSAKGILFAGGVVTLGNYDLTIANSFVANIQQLFNCNGTGIVKGTAKVDKVFAEYWGATGDGTTLDAAKINQALVTAAIFGVTLHLLNLAYKCNIQVTYDTSRTSIEMNGATLDFTGIAAGTTAVLLTTSQTNSALQIPFNTAHVLRGGYLKGPASNNVSPQYAIGFQAATISGYKFIPGTKISGVSASGFYGMFALSDGTFISTFEDCSYSNNGVSTGNMFVLTGSSNAGERYNIVNPAVLNCDGFIMDAVGNQNADFYVYSPSIDGSSWVAIGGTSVAPSSTSARVHVYGGHYEGLTNTYLAYAGTTGNILLDGMLFVFQSAIAHTLFKSDATLLHGGVQLLNCTFSDNSLGGLSGEFMCDGNGRFVTKNCTSIGGTKLRHSSVASNKVPNFNFAASNDLLLNWTASGSATYDNTVAPTGATASGKIAGNGSFDNQSIPVSAGDIVDGQMWLKTSGIVAASASITLFVQYRSIGNQTLGSFTQTITTDFASFTLFQLLETGIAPPGTVILDVRITLTSSGGSPIVWFGRPCISIH